MFNYCAYLNVYTLSVYDECLTPALVFLVFFYRKRLIPTVLFRSLFYKTRPNISLTTPLLLRCETFLWWTREVNRSRRAEQSGPGSLNWSYSSQRMWLITGQLATGTCANAGEGWECNSSESHYHSTHLFSKTVLMTFPLHVLFLFLQCSAYTAKDSLQAKTINYACH